ncbi:MAG: extracellular solute-binding protein [Magnetococcus sp. YQC-9]
MDTRHPTSQWIWTPRFLIILLLLLFAKRPVLGAEPLVIVTPFPKVTYEPFQRAFEKSHPEIKLEIIRLKTDAAIKAIQKGVAEGKSPDLFWASAKDAFEILSDDDQLVPYHSAVPGVAQQIGGQPIHDTDHHFTGFALSSYGIMWNGYFTRLHQLPDPEEWEDLTHPAYFGQLSMCTPALSGTTHMTVESILQNYGWDEGWRLLKALGGNVREFARNSGDVPDAVTAGTAGAGVVIDFYALTNKASGHDVAYTPPKRPSLVPANIALIKNGPNSKAAKQFIDFLLTPEGQKILLLPEINRLPVNPTVYAQAPRGFPNPFTNKSLLAAQPFDVELSKKRYAVINQLFDATLVKGLPELKSATKAIHLASKTIEEKTTWKTPWFTLPWYLPNVPNLAWAREKLAEARKRLGTAPITLEESTGNLAEIFSEVSNDKLSAEQKGKQAQIRARWQADTRQTAKEAEKLAQLATQLLNNPNSVPNEQTPAKGAP